MTLPILDALYDHDTPWPPAEGVRAHFNTLRGFGALKKEEVTDLLDRTARAAQLLQTPRAKRQLTDRPERLATVRALVEQVPPEIASANSHLWTALLEILATDQELQIGAQGLIDRLDLRQDVPGGAVLETVAVSTFPVNQPTLFDRLVIRHAMSLRQQALLRAVCGVNHSEAVAILVARVEGPWSLAEGLTIERQRFAQMVSLSPSATQAYHQANLYQLRQALENAQTEPALRAWLVAACEPIQNELGTGWYAHQSRQTGLERQSVTSGRSPRPRA